MYFSGIAYVGFTSKKLYLERFIKLKEQIEKNV